MTRVIGPLYPFGYGLSYTDFAYTDLEVRKQDDNRIDVSFDLANTGRYEGTEVVQLYVRDRYSSVVTYDSVLRGFERVSLKPGEKRRVRFTLTGKDLCLLGKDMQWVTEAGDFDVLVGASSADIRLQGTFTIERDQQY